MSTRHGKPPLPKAYHAIRKEAHNVGWPITHRDDLEQWDKKILTSLDAPNQFLWVLHQDGTVLLDIHMDEDSVDYYLQQYRGNTSNRYYYWNGKKLTYIDFKTFSDLLIKVNCRGVSYPDSN